MFQTFRNAWKIPELKNRLLFTLAILVVYRLGLSLIHIYIDHENVNLGKAGRKRHMGVRPGSRGTVMNPCDHPHGGGRCV